jgi:uncharacterized protein YjiS (DUF1127 family)
MNNFFLNSLSRLGSLAAEAHRRSKARQSLEQLSDRQLDDIGVDRSQIASFVIHGRRR